jgi:lactate dehydrogenase-like 2-hydroxyacid dehydrogenase
MAWSALICMARPSASSAPVAPAPWWLESCAVGCRVLAQDVAQDIRLVEELGVRYVDLMEIFRESDIISLQFRSHLGTRHLIDSAALAQMKPGVLLINAGRGARIETQYLVTALKRDQIGGPGATSTKKRKVCSS